MLLLAVGNQVMAESSTARGQEIGPTTQTSPPQYGARGPSATSSSQQQDAMLMRAEGHQAYLAGQFKAMQKQAEQQKKYLEENREALINRAIEQQKEMLARNIEQQVNRQKQYETMYQQALERHTAIATQRSEIHGLSPDELQIYLDQQQTEINRRAEELSKMWSQMPPRDMGPGLGQQQGFGPGMMRPQFGPGVEQGSQAGPGRGFGRGFGQGPQRGPGMMGPEFGPGQGFGPGFGQGPQSGPGFGAGQGPGYMGPGSSGPRQGFGPSFGQDPAMMGPRSGSGQGYGPGFRQGPQGGPGFGPGFGQGPQGDPGFGTDQGPGFGPGFGREPQGGPSTGMGPGGTM